MTVSKTWKYILQVNLSIQTVIIYKMAHVQDKW